MARIPQRLVSAQSPKPGDLPLMGVVARFTGRVRPGVAGPTGLIEDQAAGMSVSNFVETVRRAPSERYRELRSSSRISVSRSISVGPVSSSVSWRRVL